MKYIIFFISFNLMVSCSTTNVKIEDDLKQRFSSFIGEEIDYSGLEIEFSDGIPLQSSYLTNENKIILGFKNGFDKLTQRVFIHELSHYYFDQNKKYDFINKSEKLRESIPDLISYLLVPKIEPRSSCFELYDREMGIFHSLNDIKKCCLNKKDNFCIWLSKKRHHTKESSYYVSIPFINKIKEKITNFNDILKEIEAINY